MKKEQSQYQEENDSLLDYERGMPKYNPRQGGFLRGVDTEADSNFPDFCDPIDEDEDDRRVLEDDGYEPDEDEGPYEDPHPIKKTRRRPITTTKGKQIKHPTYDLTLTSTCDIPTPIPVKVAMKTEKVSITIREILNRISNGPLRNHSKQPLRSTYHPNLTSITDNYRLQLPFKGNDFRS